MSRIVHDLNPVFKLGKFEFLLTEICHSAGMTALAKHGDGAYLAAYFKTMLSLCPEHPCLEHAPKEVFDKSRKRHRQGNASRRDHS